MRRRPTSTASTSGSAHQKASGADSKATSSSEGLWCRFEGDQPITRQLRAWAGSYQRDAWSAALADHGVEDADLAEALADRFGVERRARHEVFADVVPTLSALRDSDHTLGLITNGAACLQDEKLSASGLRAYFNTVVVSAEVGVGKPDAAIFQHALAQLGADADNATMIGDSVSCDVRGAVAAGLGAVWVNREGGLRLADIRPAVEVEDLSGLAVEMDPARQNVGWF